METVKTQDVTVNDLNWKIDYDPDRCTMCGSCVAACTFNAIEVVVERHSMKFEDALVDFVDVLKDILIKHKEKKERR